MLSLLMILLSAATFGYVLYPLFSKNVMPYGLKPIKDQHRDDLANMKQKLYTDIKDLDFEYGIGKIAEADYQNLRQATLKELADVLKRMDAIEQGDNGNGKISDEYLEHLIQSRRAKTIVVQKAICPSCQHENMKTAKFCSECGAKLNA
ncbi:MAG TPA: zinc ribbon domain-containing protein [bacterium]|nr:zinc ribbon domain-containing protein [bacterium]HMW32805.1 zinc ribbon domain-containing protein [bacterium]HMW34896.1 zinc ribbon domain-containing protein [bacterium]HMY35594.1 zinc ribbon domain-containing protein [bacterium]HMZ05584.1 zinc ribbon domain-containing protein [bacterium]